MNKWQKLGMIFELLVFGIIIGIAEDLIAIKITTGEQITMKTVGIVLLVAIPFAVLGEVVFDRIDFASILKRIFGKNK